jgi:hypothetical protein
MKLSTRFIGSLLAAGSSCIISAGEVTSTLATPAETPSVTGSAALGYNSIYEFRGVDLGSNMVEASAGLSTTINGFGITASAWYATVNDNANNVTPNELDLTLGITKTLGPVTLSGGYIYYNFFDLTDFNTQEVYLGASMEVIAGISANVTAYRDFDLYDAWYFDCNLSKTFKPTSSVDIVTTVGIGLADDHGLQLKSSGEKLDGYQSCYAMITVPWTIRKGVTLAPYIKYVCADDELVSDYPGGVVGEQHLIGGIKLNLTF